MSIVIKDTDVDKSNLIKFRSLNVKRELYSKPDSCFFTYKKYGSRSYIPAGGNEIGVWDGTTKIFGGKIINVKKKIEGEILVYDVECKDWVDTLDKKLVTETYENMTVNDIITDIQANYATDFDITNVACTTVIEKIDFAAMPVSKCLDKLAEITGYHWYVDPDKYIYFFSEGSQSSPFNLTDTNGKYNTQSLEIEEDHTQIKNKVNIQGGSISNVQVSDATSISTYGEHEIIIRDDTLTSTDEATQKANAVLADYKDPIFKGSFITNEAGLSPGQQINVQSTIRDINQDFVIQSVNFNARTPEDFEYTVKIMTQRDKELMEFLQNQAMQPLPTPALGNTQFSSNIKFSITNYHEISWAAGTIIMSDGKEYSIASGSQAFSGTNIIYFKPTTSETVLQFSATLADGMGSDRLAIAYCVENSNTALGAQVIPMGYHGGIRAWGGENIVARTIVADQIGLNSLVSNLVTTGEFITLSAQIKNAIITDAHIVNLSATKITAGTMNAARINGGDINGVTITGVTITGGTVRTNNATYPYAQMNSSGLQVNGRYATFRNTSGTSMGDVWGDSSEFRIYSYSGVPMRISSPSYLYLDGGSGVQLQHGGTSYLTVTSSALTPKVDVLPYQNATFSLGNSSYKWTNLYISNAIYLDSNRPIYWNGTSYYFKHDGSYFRLNDDFVPISNGSYDLGNSSYRWRSLYLSSNISCSGAANIAGITCNGNLQPNSSNSRYCGTSGAYWARVYSDAYFTKNTTFQTFDKYDDLQILRNLKFDKKDKLILKNLPKEIAENGFINFGGLQSFNLCASKKIVEYIDDLKKQVDFLNKKITKLERR